jgi:RNA polymerase sigma-70 factor, ECF subfamily
VVRVRPFAVESEPFGASVPGFPELFEAQSPYVWTTLRRLGVRPSDLEDLTHDVFVQVFKQRAQYDPSRPIKPWLFGFAFRIAAKHRERGPQRLEVPAEIVEAVDPSPSAVDQLLAAERRDLAWAALEALELNRRAVLILHEIDGCAVPEIAESLGVPLATAYSRLRLAREEFAKAARRLRACQR